MSAPRKRRLTPVERQARIAQRMSAGTIEGRIEVASPARKSADPRIAQSTPPPGSHTHDGTGLRSTVVGGVNEADPGKAIASQTNAVAIGDYSQALGSDSIAIGSGDFAGSTSISIDAAAYASSEGANIAIGNATAGGGAISIGDGSGAITENSVAVGVDAYAGDSVEGAETDATALGCGANALHKWAVALGKNASTSARDQVAIGARHIEMRVPFSSVATPADHYGRWYAKEISGETQPYFKSDAGTEYNLASGGGGVESPQFYKSGAGVTVDDTDFASPADGIVAVAFDTATSKTFLWARANGVWKSVELT